MGKTTNQSQARERARAARAAADADRVERDKRIEAAQVDYFTAIAERDDLVEQITAIDTRLTDAIEAIATEGEPVDRVAALLDSDVPSVRKLRRAAKRAETTSADADEVSEPLGDSPLSAQG